MTSPNSHSPRNFSEIFQWTRHSSIILSIFFLTIGLILYVWWPLAEEVLSYINWDGPWWLYMDWLLIGIFLFMSIAIVSRADLKVDTLTIFVATVGGLVIESWGTQTNLWHYYTAERPPLWIIPAWPIATLTINRIVLALGVFSPDRSLSGADHNRRGMALKITYWLLFSAFFLLMVTFIAPTFDKSFTILATLLVILLIITPTDHRLALLTFIAGAGLGYFLELWGTTRECWTYYTYQKPPLFAVLAHGMAAVAFWRTELLLKMVWNKVIPKRPVAVEEMAGD
jgi:hypothetical protein